MRVGRREIVYTSVCMFVPGRGHWHASSVVPSVATNGVRVGESYYGTGHCFTFPAAFLWLLTGLARKPRRAW